MEPKERSVGAAERDEFPRRAWRAVVAEGAGADRFVFVDERGANVAPISSATLDGVGPSLVVEGATTGAVLEACAEEALPPGPRAGRVAAMYNLSAHKGERIGRLIEGKGCEPVYPPPYSPDFNPIERAFSKVKGMPSKAEQGRARPRPAPARR